jgi:hypothetical protein
MRLFSKLFSRRADPELERAVALLRKALENSTKPQGAYKAAIAGAEIRRRFFTVVEDVEAKIGQRAFGIASAEGALMVHPKLLEEVRNQADADLLEIAFTHCFITKDARRRVMDTWPASVARCRGKSNSEAVLHEKSFLLATYVTSNFDAAEMAEGETSDEQLCMVQVEEGAVWYRILDELAFRFIRGQRELFVDYLQDDLAFSLALLGSSPDLIDQTMVARSLEYAEYRQWTPADPSVRGAMGGTLLWEAAKHVGEPIGLEKNLFFLVQFGTQFLQKLNSASVYELLTGNEHTS